MEMGTGGDMGDSQALGTKGGMGGDRTHAQGAGGCPWGWRGCPMGAHPTLLGCTVRRRFSIQRSRSAKDVQPKERLPSAVMIWVQGRCQEGTPGCPGDGPGLGCLWLC